MFFSYRLSFFNWFNFGLHICGQRYEKKMKQPSISCCFYVYVLQIKSVNQISVLLGLKRLHKCVLLKLVILLYIIYILYIVINILLPNNIAHRIN